MRFNIVSNEGEKASATVFFGAEAFIATKDHPAFGQIVAALEDGTTPDEDIKALFDVTIALGKKFTKLSERVMINAGRIFFDGVEIHSALTDTIVKFFSDGYGDFMPLVNFLEKVMLNENQHSKDNLFRWLSRHKFAICPDGDFIAYKGIDSDGKSRHAGEAFVNGELITGRIPNQPDTVIEMARNKVQHDPSQGCSYGLHVANWRYASGWSSNRIRVKVNPRDVVSVPTESGDEKMRVCRYLCLGPVTAEDKEMLFVDVRERLAVSKAVERNVVKPKPEPEVAAPDDAGDDTEVEWKRQPIKGEFPEYYEQFTKKHFEACQVKELRWVAKEFEITGASKTPKDALIPMLLKVGRARKRSWPKEG